MENNPNKPDGSGGLPTPMARPPFNELSVLFPLLTLYTVGYLGLMIADFAMKGALNLSPALESGRPRPG